MAIQPMVVGAVPKPLYMQLYFQVLVGVLLGVIIGLLWPTYGAAMKPLGDAFIAIVKMIIAPVIFVTVTLGLGRLKQGNEAGSVIIKALAYFIVVSSFALLIGLITGNLIQPGLGLHATAASLDASSVKDAATYAGKAKDLSVVGSLLAIIPKTWLSALTDGDILQVLFVAIISGFALSAVGERAAPVLNFLESANAVIFRIVGILMRAAPIGAFGAMAFTIGKFGVAALVTMAWLLGTFYLTSLLFILVVLGAIAHFSGFSILKLIRYIKGELLIVLGTSSSEAALPSLMEKLEAAGAKKDVVGLVVPAGYSFNLDGTNIYMTLAALYIAQAMDINLSIYQQLSLLLVAIISSKGAAGVTGSGFIVLASTLAIVPEIPLAGMALILGIDRFMSECRALTNLIGNAVATLVVAGWEGALDRDVLKKALG
ncbi:MAG: C4-dicarboxylate transporter DctA [Pseudomonadota bacterium]|nr:C4-dicarboxylate transporter DctA [Pseudomonadota bacterium]